MEPLSGSSPMPVLKESGLNPPEDMLDLRLELSSIDPRVNRAVRAGYKRDGY